MSSPPTTTTQLLERAAEADEADRSMFVHELLEIPAFMHPDSGSNDVMADFESAVAEWRGEQNDSFLRCILSVDYFRHALYKTILFRFIHDGMTIGVAYILRGFVVWLVAADSDFESGGFSKWAGFVWAGGIGLGVAVMLCAFAWSSVSALEGLQTLQSILTQACWNKAQRIRGDILDSKRGSVISLHSSESATLKTNMQLASVFSTIPSLIGLVVSLCLLTGLPGLVAVGLVIIFALAQQYISKSMSTVRRRYLAAADVRIKAISHAVSSIKILKLLSLEDYYYELIQDLRDNEVAELFSVYVRRAWIIGLSHLLAPALQVGVFGAVYGRGEPIVADAVFPVLLLLNLLRGFMTSFAMSMSKMVDMLASFERYGELLQQPEKVSYVGKSEGGDEAAAATAIEVTRPVTFGFHSVEKKKKNSNNSDWPSSSLPIHPIISVPAGFNIPACALTCIVGATGAGATTLLLGLLGEAEIIDPEAAASAAPVIHNTSGGAIAFCPQDAWIQNASVRRNITLFDDDDEAALLSSDAAISAYAAALYDSCLLPDLAALPAGDSTEAGARGVTLSGGQRARIQIARALYAVSTRAGSDNNNQKRTMIVAMDSVLSAVDSHVAKALIEQVIFGSTLRETTRILVSNTRNVVQRADHVVALSSDHEILFSGPSADFQVWAREHQYPFGGASNNNNASPPSSPIAASSSFDVDSSSSVINNVAAHIQAAAAESRFYFGEKHSPQTKSSSISKQEEQFSSGLQHLARKEKIHTQSVALSTYLWHFSRGSWWLTVGTHVGFALWRISHSLQDWSLSRWTEHGEFLGVSDDPSYMLIFSLAALGTAMFTTIRQVTYTFWLGRISTNLISEPLRATLSAPLVYFDTVSSGAILNVFSSDVEKSDVAIGEELIFLLSLFYLMMSQLVLVIVGGSVLMLPVVLVAGTTYVVARRNYAIGLRNVRRVENASRSPLLSLINELTAPSGASSVRLYGLSSSATGAHVKKLVHLLRAGWSFVACQEYATNSVAIVGSLVASCTALLITGLKITVVEDRLRANTTNSTPDSSISTIWPGDSLAALGLTMSITLCVSLNYFMIMSAQTAATFASVERIKSQSEVPGEGQDELMVVEDSTSCSSWPSAGAISIRNISMRYRPGLPLVLKGMAMELEGGHRVALVGSTGSGKSSVISCLFRLVNIEQGDTESGIFIDGRNIQHVSLRSLRSSISIVPQEPQLIGADLRTVLDVTQESSDENLWVALGMVGLQRVVLKRSRREQQQKQRKTEPFASGDDDEEMSPNLIQQQQQQEEDEHLDVSQEEIHAALDLTVREGGTDFSNGQRQLLCLARVLVRTLSGQKLQRPRCKILCLDECSASLDEMSDRRLQHVLRTHFVGFTLVTIAHRLATIADYDRVAVLDNGQVAEFDTPLNLLRDSTSRFAGMVRALGEEGAKEVLDIAAENNNDKKE